MLKPPRQEDCTEDLDQSSRGLQGLRHQPPRETRAYVTSLDSRQPPVAYNIRGRDHSSGEKPDACSWFGLGFDFIEVFETSVSLPSHISEPWKDLVAVCMQGLSRVIGGKWMLPHNRMHPPWLCPMRASLTV